MRFVHFADCHLDGYREEKLTRLSFEHFITVIDFAINNHVDFALLAGDLFNSALPKVDVLKETVEQLKRLQDANIPIYAIPGSHDFSPHGKTMFDVLHKAGLLTNVMQGEVDIQGRLQLTYTVDPKTKSHIAGIIGKKGMLDKQIYENLAPLQPQEDVINIFLFHTSITELKPKELTLMESEAVSILPAGFDYYAGGHVHIVEEFSSERYKNVVYPGPTFPNNFAELEKLKRGSFVFFDSKENFGGKHYKHIFIEKKKVLNFNIDVEGKNPQQINEIIHEKIAKQDLNDTILLFRLGGKLSEGKVADIDFKTIFQELYAQGAYMILRNTYNIIAPMFEEIDVKEGTAKEIEEETIKEHLGQITVGEEKNEEEIIKQLLKELSVEQMDGEKKSTFVERVQKTAQNILEK